MIKSKTKTFLNHFIVAYFTLNREIKKRRGRKNSRIPREKIEESLRRKINHMDAHPAVIDSNVSLASRESIWRLRKRKKGGIIRDTARTRPRRANKMIGDEKGAARRRWFCWCKKGEPPLRIALKETDCVGLSCPPPSSSGQLSINLRP